MSGKPKKIFGISKEIIEERLLYGETQKEIAESFSVKSQTIQYYRRKFGCNLLKVAKYQTACSIEGCNNKVHGYGLCNLHYKRVNIYGDPSTHKFRNDGEGTPHISGYWVHTINGKTKLRHILIAEKALGKTLPLGAEVHHFDRNRQNDQNNNLVICQNRTYHKLIEKRHRLWRQNYGLPS